jgi:hypothetical protein
VTEVDFSSFSTLRAAGFLGFSRIRDLHASLCGDVPRQPGVYLVVRDAAHSGVFAERSRGGRFKGKDPTLPVPRLRRLWIDNAIVLYIGKAGGGASGAVLQERLWVYMRFGAGEPVGHWGGRLIWQIENCHDLIVCWRASGDVDAAKLEGDLIRKFAMTYGRRPFANLRN